MRAVGSSAVTKIGDDEILPRRKRAEVDQRRLQLERGPQRAVVGLIERAPAVGVGERAARCVEHVRVGILERRRERQRRRAALSGRAVDPLVERAEAHAAAVVLEALPEPVERHEVVENLRQLARPADGGLSERQVRVRRRHARSFPDRSPGRKASRSGLEHREVLEVLWSAGGALHVEQPIEGADAHKGTVELGF